MERFDVLVLTKNEEPNLRYALKSVVGWARRVFVVDSGSIDGTVELAKELGATVVHQDWLGYAGQKNWALDNLPFESNWILIIDADETVMPDLHCAIERVLSTPASAVPEVGFFVNRYFIFLGKRIRHCGYYPSYNLRFFKRGHAHYEERDVHEHMIADGPVGYLDGHLEHNDRRGLENYMAKHNRYSTLEAREVFQLLHDPDRERIRPKFTGDPLQRRRWLKQVIYPRLPAKALGRFLFMYVAKLGFLDGLTGLRFSLFMSAYELLIELKLQELRIASKGFARGPRG